MNVWLKYRQRGAALGVTTAMRFDALEARPNDETTRLEQVGLRKGTGYSHLAYSKPVWTIRIGPDELSDATKKAFCDEFWISAQAWLVVSDSATEPAANLFREVNVPSGPAPYRETGGTWSLPTMEMTLAAKVGD